MNAQEMYDTGLPILTELFNMPHKDLRVKLLSICGDKYKEIIEEGRVLKIAANDEPYQIQIYYYDTLEIGVMGISFKPEHGNWQNVVSFDEHFKL